MKKNKAQNYNGIRICDSIVMSVKKKNMNLRRAESIFIALAGYISTIMVFITTFDFDYKQNPLIISSIIFSAIYILLSSLGKYSLWLIMASLAAFGTFFWKKLNAITLGYKFVYNVIYQESYKTEINYYKFLDEKLEIESVTTFFIFGAWLLSVIIYVFTIYHPHPLPPLIASFSILEIGLYNGIKVNIWWAMLVVAFLVASFAMSTIDIGEYSGGNGGFVRKGNLFFPKRQMRLKVTEKCGVYLILLIMACTAVSAGILKATNYERSDELKQKRVEIRDAVNNFSTENLADSITDLSAALGFEIKLDTHKLGNVATMKYKDKTDLILNIDQPVSEAIYIKEYTGSVYRDNEWVSLPDSAYKSEVFDEFKNFNIYPQDFPFIFSSTVVFPYSSYYSPERTMKIQSEVKGNKTFAPYGVDNIGGLSYDRDMNVSSQKKNSNKYSYKFINPAAEYISTNFENAGISAVNLGNINDEEWRNKLIDYCKRYNKLEYDSFTYINSVPSSNPDIVRNPDFVAFQLIQEQYRDFVYENYLSIPDTSAMQEIRENFVDLLDTDDVESDPAYKLNILYALRGMIADNAEYSLSPGKTPKNRDFINYFLLENNKGYCTHYATSGVILARMAGIPARYATGYVLVSDDFNNDNLNADGTYTIKVKDNRRHAWAEIYVDGCGWLPFEFTEGYTAHSIDTTPTTTTTSTTTETTTTATISTEINVTKESSETSQQNTDRITQTVSRTTASTTSSTVSSANKNTFLSKFFNVLKNIGYAVLVIIVVILIFIIRQRIITALRRRKFNVSNPTQLAKNIYIYAEKILKYKNIEIEGVPYKKISEFVEHSYGGIYFENGEFEEFMDISLSSAFSDTPPDMKNVRNNRAFVESFAEKIYNKSGRFSKIYLKYIICLI